MFDLLTYKCMCKRELTFDNDYVNLKIRLDNLGDRVGKESNIV